MLKLHFVSGTRAGRIAWLLEELGIEYELNHMQFSAKDLKNDAYRKISPLGRIPVLEDGDVTIYESGAIVEYILARHTENNGGLKPEVDSPLFPEYLQWFNYCEGMVMPPMNTIVVHTMLLPEDRRDPVVLKQAKKLLTKALLPLEQTLEGREYMLGDFSAVDVMLGHACYMSRLIAKVVGEDMPNINAYLDRIKERPAFDKGFNL